jgi:hypothetical protein
MRRQQLPSARRPVAWALLSQSLWLPLLVVDLQDRWKARVEEFSPRVGSEPQTATLLAPTGPAGSLPLPKALSGAAANTGLLLGSGSPSRSIAPRAIDQPVEASVGNAPLAFLPSPSATTSLTRMRPNLVGAPEAALRGGFSRAELLGGPITLDDLNEATIPPLAQAERGRRALGGDPLAALPDAWREPMRQALTRLPAPTGGSPRIGNARHVHVPSSRVSAPTSVPLALQSDGSVDILNKPESEAVIEDIRDWSARQAPPSEGSVAPALVQLHPVAATPPPLRPSPADLQPEINPIPEPIAPPSETPSPTPQAATP